MMDLELYVEVEEGLSDKLMKSWRSPAQKLYAKMLKLVEKADFDGARKLIEDVDLTDVGEKNKGVIRSHMYAAAMFGAKVASEGKKPMMSVGKYDTTMKHVTDLFCRTLEWNATVYTVKAALQSIARAEAAYLEADAVVKKAEGKRRFVKEFASFQKNGDDMIKLTSSLHTSRLATWGFTGEAELLGVTTYQLQAVMDGRTSEFCQIINGKIFLVEDARRTVVEVLNIDNPDDAKWITPWPSQSKASLEAFKGMDSKQLTDKNLHIPPFHPGCRTILVTLGYAKTMKERPFKAISKAKAEALSPDHGLTSMIPLAIQPWFALYSTSAHHRINKVMRHPEILDEGWTPPAGTEKLDEILDAVVKMSTFMSSAKAVMKQDMYLYRGMGPEIMGKIDSSAIGKVFEDSGFMSFTYDQFTAGEFGDFQIKVKARKGDLGYADMYDVSGMSEHEILRKGGRFKITGFDEDLQLFDAEFLDN